MGVGQSVACTVEVLTVELGEVLTVELGEVLTVELGEVLTGKLGETNRRVRASGWESVSEILDWGVLLLSPKR